MVAGSHTPAGSVTASDREVTYVRGVIEFLDKRWTAAESDAGVARRSLLLLSGVAMGLAVVAVSLAGAAAGFVVLLQLAQDLLGLGAPDLVAAVLAGVGVGGAAVALHARRYRPGRRREDRHT
jgi:hypothetical protein